MTCILSVMWAVTCSHPCFLKTIYFTTTKKSYFIYFDNPFYNSHNVHYTKGRGTLAEGEHLWLVPTARPSWGRVKYALGMDTQN